MAGCLCLRQKTASVLSLDYRHSNLDYIPSDVFRHERTLEELCVDANQIKELPRELFCCHELKKLCLADNEVRVIPSAISSLEHLEELDVSKNGVVNFPDNIKHCKNMRRIEASVNPLGKLPEGFTQLHQLTELYLNDAFLDFLPGSFGRLSKLKILEVRENHLKTLPRSMSHMLLLQRLDIGNNDFTELPDVIGSLSCLLELWCDSNQITSIPAVIGNLRQLIFLDASKNRVETIAPEIEGCVALGDLHLSTNLLQNLPETIGRLSNLTTLKIDDNRVNTLPFSIGGLVSLSELTVTSNDLEEIPPSIGLLRHLRTLYAHENFLRDVPPELGSCNGLTVLSLRSNNLRSVPDELGRIPRLRVLNLSDNKLQHLPFSLTRLKELQALWLSENQTKPLIRLQSELDPDTGQRRLTCYLLPQQTTNPSDDHDDGRSESGSFHPSIWEEERATRQTIHFDTVEEEETEEGKLRRQPTPYPKEMKHRIQHMRNLALKELNVPDSSSAPPRSVAAPVPEQSDKVVGRRDSPMKANAGSNTTRTLQSPNDRPQRPQQTQKGAGDQVDDGGFLTGCRRRGSAASQLSLPRAASLDHTGGPSMEAKSAGSLPRGHSVSYTDFRRGLEGRGGDNLRGPPTDILAPRTARSLPGHTRRRGSTSRGYDSDTGYRSDYGYHTGGHTSGYISDNGYRSDGHHRSHRSHRHNRLAGGGYSSDGETRHRRPQHHTGRSNGHNTSHNTSQRSQHLSYNNAPMLARTTIRNDEMYESNPSRVVRSRSAGDDLAVHPNGYHGNTSVHRDPGYHGDTSVHREPGYSSLSNGYHGDSMTRTNGYPSDRQMSESMSDSRSQVNHSYETIREEHRAHPNTHRGSQHTDNTHRGSQHIDNTHRSSQHTDHTQAPPWHSVSHRQPTRPAVRFVPHKESNDGSQYQRSHTSQQSLQSETPNNIVPPGGTPSKGPRPNTLPLGDARKPPDSNHNKPTLDATRSQQGPGPPSPRSSRPRLAPQRSNYEADVALYKLEPLSQVSSSTDSGYGHLHDRSGTHDLNRSTAKDLHDRSAQHDLNRSSVSTSDQPSPGRGSVGHPSKHVFHVTLTKNPGLGFSIAGGVGSPGNPFRPSDLGIFITRVQTDGPGSDLLKPADKILQVNGVDFTLLEHSRAVDVLRNSGHKVAMVIERLQMAHNL